MIIIRLILVIISIILSVNVSGQETDISQESEKEGEKQCHNFSHASWLQVSEVCRVCHVLHSETKAIQYYVNGLLWTRNISSIVFNLYHSSWGASLALTRDVKLTSSATGRTGNVPDGISKLCLSCHDGLIAPDVFTLHHFVSVEYDTEKTTLREPEATTMGLSGTISNVLDAGLVQCSSCHDVHGEEALKNTKLLRAMPSEICTICHRINVDWVNTDG